MIMSDFLKTEINLPSIHAKKMLVAFSLVLLCNVVFWVLAYHTSTARPLVNVDYFLGFLLLCLPIKPKLLPQILGVLFLFIAFVFDVMMLVMQLFPFMDLAGFIYFLPFVKVAPTLYQLLIGVGVLLLVALFFAVVKLSAKTDAYHVSLLSVLFVVLWYFTQYFQYHDRGISRSMFGANNFYYIKSQYALYHENQKIDFISEVSVTPQFSPYVGERASEHLKQSDKILFIVNESWGQFKNKDLHHQVIHALSEQSHRFEYFEQGYFPFQDSTINGELRELCGLQVKGYALNRLKTNELGQCLPNLLRDKNYQTVAMHGASGRLYERYSWYPKAGFEEVIFAEHLMDKKKCQAFRGVCDTQLSDVVKDHLSKHDKIFFYWLTLTTHAPYELVDLEKPTSIECTHYQMKDDSELCKSAKMQEQFFGSLARLVSSPEMAGVEVVVVGDHIPPTDNFMEPIKYLQDNSVAWLHFKVKEK